MAIQNDDILLVKYICTSKPPDQNLSLSLNTVYYKAFNKGGNGATEQQIADALSNRVAASYRLFFNGTTSYDGLILNKVFPLPMGVKFVSISGAGVGARISEQLPMQIAGIITKYTAFAGRKFRGRNYIPYPLEDDNLPVQKPTPAHVAALQAHGALLYNGISVGVPPDTTELKTVIFHGPPSVPVSTDVTTFSARNYWVTQRRRMNAFLSDALPLL